MWFGFKTPMLIPVWIQSVLAMTSLVFGAGVGLTHYPDRRLSLMLLCAKDSELWFGLAFRQS